MGSTEDDNYECPCLISVVMSTLLPDLFRYLLLYSVGFIKINTHLLNAYFIEGI